MADRPKILIMNDDGIHSEGIEALERAMLQIGEVYVVAAESEMSGASHSLTLARPLRIRPNEVTRKAMVNGLPDGTLLNINVPKGIPKSIRITKQGFKSARPVISEHIDPRGKAYYWIGEIRDGFRAEGGTDFEAVDEGYVSITPMRSDLTSYDAIAELKSWES